MVLILRMLVKKKRTFHVRVIAMQPDATFKQYKIQISPKCLYVLCYIDLLD